MYVHHQSPTTSSTYTTTEIALAAFLKALGWTPKVIPPRDGRRLCLFVFTGESSDLHQQAEAFLNGASIRALDFFDALNSLRTLVRYARGGSK